MAARPVKDSNSVTGAGVVSSGLGVVSSGRDVELDAGLGGGVDDAAVAEPGAVVVGDVVGAWFFTSTLISAVVAVVLPPGIKSL
jgi:hypothetical protein